MDLYILFGQRRERYEGQHAPEALEVIDEYVWEENGQWLRGRREERRANEGSEWAALKIIRVTGIDQDSLRRALLDTPEVAASGIEAAS